MTYDQFWLALLIYAAVFGWLGSYVGKSCGRSFGEGLFMGAVFGPLGVIVMGLLPKFPHDK